MSMDEPAPLSFLDQSAVYSPPVFLSAVKMDAAETNIGVHETAAAIYSQDHDDPINPNSQEGGTSNIHQDPADIFVIALTRQYLKRFLAGIEPTDRQVGFLVHQVRVASRNEF